MGSSSRTLTAAAAAVLLAGCAITPRPLTPEENAAGAQQDLASIVGKLEPQRGPMTLAEATARAIRNNLEVRVRQMEESVASGQLDLSKYDMLPRLALSAGYNWRNNDAFGVGYQPNGVISTVPSAAVERIHSTANAALTWNVLDFGLSYYRARQNADQVVIAQERRRRALQNLVLDTRLAWWRAEAAQRLLPQIDAMLDQIDRSAEKSRLIEARRLMPPLQIIGFRRALLDLEQQLSQRRQDLAQWRTEFAELVGLRPGETYRVAPAPVAAFLQSPELISRADDLEAMAIERRPELAEERLRVRITQAEGKRQLLSLLPNLGLNFGNNYDSNRFLVNNQWTEAGALLSMNLLKLLSLPAMKRGQQAAEDLDKARREALTLAVMAQTRVALTRYELLRHEAGIWNQALADDRSMLAALQASQQSGLESELELIRAGARVAVTEINRDIVHANLEHALGRVMNSVGYDVVTAQSDASDTPALAAQVDAAFGSFAQEHFATLAPDASKAAVIGQIVGVPREVQKEFTDSMRAVMRVAQIPVADKGAVLTDVAVKLAPRQESGHPVTLKVTLADGSTGNMLYVVQMNSMLVDPITTDQWKVLAEAAVFKVAENLRRLLAGRSATPRDTLTLTESGPLKLDRNWSGPRGVPSGQP